MSWKSAYQGWTSATRRAGLAAFSSFVLGCGRSLFRWEETMQPTSGGIAEQQGEVLPDHTQLPESDGAIVENFQEHPQGELLTSKITPRLHELHPDDQYCIGHDSGIYWRY